MTTGNVPDLHSILQQGCQRIRKPKKSTLFREGENAFGMFVVFSGTVRLDFGVDCPLSRSYGPGALLGLPATMTKRNYSMTATVTEDAEVGLWTPGALNTLLLKHPELCQQLLVLLCERLTENHQIMKALHDKQPGISRHSDLA
jgi:CRP-like cAMP-binding protein